MSLSLINSFGDHVAYSNFKINDTINVLSFNKTGQFLASGDFAGRIVIFQITTQQNNLPVVSLVKQIHAHKSRFDYLRSELTDSRINSLSWIKSNSLNPMLFSCNSHEVQLWRLNQSSKATWENYDLDASPEEFKLPKANHFEVEYGIELCNIYPDILTEYLIDIHSMCDPTKLLVYDIAAVKMCDIEHSNISYCLYKANQNVEITAGDFSESNPNYILMADSTGFAKILDSRVSAEDISPSICMNVVANISPNRYVSGCECISSVVFSKDAEYVVTRTFGELQVWDIRNTDAPVSQIDVHWFPGQMEWLSNDYYTRNVFKTCITNKGIVYSGSYSADFLGWNWKHCEKSSYRAISNKFDVQPPEAGKDFNKRVTVCASHPLREIIAVVSTASLYVYVDNS